MTQPWLRFVRTACFVALLGFVGGCPEAQNKNDQDGGNNTDGGTGVSVTINRTGTGSGTVTYGTDGSCTTASCTLSWPQGTALSLTAVPAADSTFVSWNCGGGVQTTAAISPIVSSGMTCVVEFAKKKFSLSVTVTPNDGGTVIITPGSLQCGIGGTMCSATGLDAGTSVTLNLIKAQNFAFVGWSGSAACTGTNANLTFALDADTACTATLLKNAIAISGSISGASGTIQYTAGSSAVGSTCTTSGCGANPDASGANVQATMTAPVIDGFFFTGWSGTGCDATTNYTINVKGRTVDTQCVASYVSIGSKITSRWPDPTGVIAKGCDAGTIGMVFDRSALPSDAQFLCRVGPTGDAAKKANDDVDKIAFTPCQDKAATNNGLELKPYKTYIDGNYRADVQITIPSSGRTESFYSYSFYMHHSLNCVTKCPVHPVSDAEFFAAALASDGYYDSTTKTMRSLNPSGQTFSKISTKSPFIRVELTNPKNDSTSHVTVPASPYTLKRNSLRRRFATYTAPGASAPSLFLVMRQYESTQQRLNANTSWCYNGFPFGIYDVNPTVNPTAHTKSRGMDCTALVVAPNGEGSCFGVYASKPVRILSSQSAWYKIAHDIAGSNLGKWFSFTRKDLVDDPG